MNYLSGVELYYCSSEKIKANNIIISDDDYKHIVKVMRHSEGDEIYVTNGRGEIFLSIIKDIKKDGLTWKHVSDLKRWGNAAAKIYGVSSIPHSVLVDKEGIIIAKNLKGEELIKELEEVVK